MAKQHATKSSTALGGTWGSEAPSPDRVTILGMRLTDLVGIGATTATYRGIQESDGKPVLVRVVLPGSDDHVVQRFLKDANAARLVEHDSILPVVAVGQHQGYAFAIRPWMEGTTLAERIRSGPLEAATAASILANLVAAVTALHDAHLVHGRIHPRNIVIDPEGRVRIADHQYPWYPWVADDERWSVRPQEEWEGGMPTPAGDIFACGVMAASALLGEIPRRSFNTERMRAAWSTPLVATLAGRVPLHQVGVIVVDAEQDHANDAPRPQAQDQAIDRNLQAICGAATHPEPSCRYDAIWRLREDTERLIHGFGPVHAALTVAKPSVVVPSGAHAILPTDAPQQPQRRAHPLITAGAGVVAGAAIGVGLMVILAGPAPAPQAPTAAQVPTIAVVPPPPAPADASTTPSPASLAPAQPTHPPENQTVGEPSSQAAAQSEPQPPMMSSQPSLTASPAPIPPVTPPPAAEPTPIGTQLGAAPSTPTNLSGTATGPAGEATQPNDLPAPVVTVTPEAAASTETTSPPSTRETVIAPPVVPPPEAASPGPPPTPSWAAATGKDQAGNWADLRVGGQTQRLRWVPAGTYRRGSPADEPGRGADETEHEVTLTKGFWLGDTEVSNALVAAASGRATDADALPATNMTAAAVNAFLTAASRTSGAALRLPTEAEWEYACRRANPDPRLAITVARGAAQPVQVADAKPDPGGFHHLLGNVAELVQDGYRPYQGEPQIDPVARGGAQRVARGGAWTLAQDHARPAARHRIMATAAYRHVGLRLAISGEP